MMNTKGLRLHRNHLDVTRKHIPHLRRTSMMRCGNMLTQTLEPVVASQSYIPVDIKQIALPDVEDDLLNLLEVLPKPLRPILEYHPMRPVLTEVVMDLGRRPEARFQDAPSMYLGEEEVTWSDLAAAEAVLGGFGGDNRAGIEGTLHRISAMRNRKGAVVGLTCRVGRAVSGHVSMIRDVLQGPESLLFLGPPGVGKTTVIREICRVLSDDMGRRVVVVDTSNEIGGDGDVAHRAIGSARRMMVPDPSQQHRVMIEAVENHMPQVVVVDEISTEAEAQACRSIAERGVRLIGTAHGQFLDNLIKNPTLSDLLGGVESVTLGDEAAKARGSQKSVLERRGPPTFPILMEIRDRKYWVGHWVEGSVDALLRGRIPQVQVRCRGDDPDHISIRELPYDEVEQHLNAFLTEGLEVEAVGESGAGTTKEGARPFLEGPIAPSGLPPISPLSSMGEASRSSSPTASRSSMDLTLDLEDLNEQEILRCLGGQVSAVLRPRDLGAFSFALAPSTPPPTGKRSKKARRAAARAGRRSS